MINKEDEFAALGDMKNMRGRGSDWKREYVSGAQPQEIGGV